MYGLPTPGPVLVALSLNRTDAIGQDHGSERSFRHSSLVYAMTLNPHGTDRIVARLLQFSLSPNVFYNILTIYSALQLIHALAVVLYISNITTQCSY